MKFCMICLSIVACIMFGGCKTVQQAWVSGEEETFKAIAPQYLAYVEANPDLTRRQKDRRRTTIETWRVRIREHGGLQGSGPVKPIPDKPNDSESPLPAPPPAGPAPSGGESR